MFRFLFFILISFQTLALSYGECIAIPSSKVYIDADFHQDFPKTISFNCRYECLADTIVEVKAKSSVTVSNFDQEARNLVCQGVIVGKGKWGYELERVEPFFIYNTRIEALKSLGRQLQVPIDTASSSNLREKLFTDLKTISSAYIIAGQNSLEFKEAGLVLEQMIDNIGLVDEYLARLKLMDYKIPRGLSSDGLIYNVLLSSAFWRI